jgi:hypothetical protein
VQQEGKNEPKIKYHLEKSPASAERVAATTVTADKAAPAKRRGPREAIPPVRDFKVRYSRVPLLEVGYIRLRVCCTRTMTDTAGIALTRPNWFGPTHQREWCIFVGNTLCWICERPIRGLGLVSGATGGVSSVGPKG